jgi:hypothetical protein
VLQLEINPAQLFWLLKKERGVPPQTNTALFKWPQIESATHKVENPES